MGDSTCWTEIEGAAAGRAEDREAFARRYLPAVGAYLSARWRGSPLAGHVDDAVQEVFLDCFREGGALARVDPSRDGGFRAFLYGIVRNVALRCERTHARQRVRPAEGDVDLEAVPADDSSLSAAFDRAWATTLLRQAAAHQREAAASRGEAALRRVELLRLRFEEGLPIREIAARWGADADRLHHEYARAREEFRQALRETVAFHHPGGRQEIDAECERLVRAIG